MNKHFNDVEQFQEKFGLLSSNRSFSYLEKDLLLFRTNFFIEELTEYKDAHNQNDLATVIDSLIDLIYITCGTALFHGITNKEFEQYLLNCDQTNVIDINNCKFKLNKKINFLEDTTSDNLIQLISKNIQDYEYYHNHKKVDLMMNSLVSIYINCIYACALIGMSSECFNEFWDDVQRANMSKEKALKNEDSKRGSAKYDIIKPKNWKAPKSEELVQKYLNL